MFYKIRIIETLEKEFDISPLSTLISDLNLFQYSSTLLFSSLFSYNLTDRLAI